MIQKSKEEVQSLIINISFPRNLDNLYEIVENGGLMDVEILIDDPEEYSWTVSKWVKPDDVVFFMHSKSSIHRIRRLKKELKNDNALKNDAEKFQLLEAALTRAEKLYSIYGRRIFSVARVESQPSNLTPEEREYTPFWKSRIYAYIKDVYHLEEPIALAEFSNYITLSAGGTITPVYGREFEDLKELILDKNNGPEYLNQCVSMPIPLMKMDDTNWLEVSSKYRMSYMYEKQFRAFYVDYFLRAFGDRRKLYFECACEKKNQNVSYVDNIILFGGKYFPVEVKLSVKAEDDIEHQLRKYCHLDKLFLDRKRKRLAEGYEIVDDMVIVIDTFAIYLYHYESNILETVYNLDDIHKSEDIKVIRDIILVKMNTSEKV